MRRWGYSPFFALSVLNVLPPLLEAPDGTKVYSRCSLHTLGNWWGRILYPATPQFSPRNRQLTPDNSHSTTHTRQRTRGQEVGWLIQPILSPYPSAILHLAPPSMGQLHLHRREIGQHHINTSSMERMVNGPHCDTECHRQNTLRVRESRERWSIHNRWIGFMLPYKVDICIGYVVTLLGCQRFWNVTGHSLLVAAFSWPCVHLFPTYNEAPPPYPWIFSATSIHFSQEPLTEDGSPHSFSFGLTANAN